MSHDDDRAYRPRGRGDEPDDQNGRDDPDEGENPDEVGTDDEVEEPRSRPRVANREAALEIVGLYLKRATRAAEVDHDGLVRVDLCYHRGDRPIRSFPLDPASGGTSQEELRAAAEEVVDEAADVLADSGDAEGRYDVRVAGQGLRTFPLRLAGATSTSSSMARAPLVHDAVIDDEATHQARAILREVREQLLDERERNNRQSEMMLQVMGVVIDGKQIEIQSQAKREKTQAKRERKLQKTINQLVKHKFETLEDREELASKKHERDREAKEEDRKAAREDAILDKIMSLGPKIAAAALAHKSPAMASLASMLTGPDPVGVRGGTGAARDPAAGGPAGAESAEAAIMRKVHGFCSAISPEQYQKMAGALDEDQQRDLYEMMLALQNHHEQQQQNPAPSGASPGPDGPNSEGR